MKFVLNVKPPSYGKLSSKDAETKPWDTLCVELIGKYQFTPKEGGKNSKSHKKEMERNSK